MAIHRLAVPVTASAGPGVGLVLVMLSAIFFAATPSFARMAFADGADASTVALARFSTGALACLWLLRWHPSPTPIRGSGLAALAALGFIYAIQALAYLNALRHMPVGIVVVIVFAFPILVAILSRLLDRAHLSRQRITGLCIAFAGVTFTTGAVPFVLDPLGIGLALIATVGTALFIFFGGRLSRQVGSVAFSAAEFSTAAVIFGAGAIVIGGLHLPASATGWFGVFAAAFSFVLGTLLLFTALMYVDTVKAAVLAYTEPLLAAGLAYLLLGERLSWIQMAGVAIAVIGIMLTILPSQAERLGAHSEHAAH